MKNKLLYIITFLGVFLLNTSIISAREYIQGIVTSSNQVKMEASSTSSTMKNDEGSNMSLSYPEAVEILGKENSYYKIRFLYSGFLYTGYFPESKMKMTKYNTDDTYENNLIASGFPADYAKRLSVLHSIHPNWTFTPSYTGNINAGMDFYTAVNGEASVVARNLISGNNTSLRSTRDGAYSNGKWIALSGSGWYAASEQTIAYYLDARNFLDESHIFMFENLGYNEKTQSEAAVNKIISSTFMNNPFNCLETANSCTLGTHTFLDTFMQSGKDSKVSPVHLASRVVQEQGSKGSVLSLGNGYNGEYVGYYNFFNFGASGITNADVILNGLKYAYNNNWNNQYISIYQGAKKLGNNYISRGQSTGYYQKFNLIAPSYYGNQYMQNIEAPYTESYSTYVANFKSYTNQDEWNNGTYDFLIPVFSNMPEKTSLDIDLNSDSTLKSLSVASCNNFTPSFQSSAYNYDCYINSSVTKTTVKAEATNSLAKITGTGDVELKNSDTTVNVEVTAADGSKSNYIINVHKIETDGVLPEEIINGIGLKLTESYVYNIVPETDISNIINSIKNKYHFAEVTVQLANGNIASSGSVETGCKITVKNAGKTSEYIIVIYGDVNGDGRIAIDDLVPIKKHIIASSTLNGAYLKAADITHDGKIAIDDLLYLRKQLLGQYTINQS